MSEFSTPTQGGLPFSSEVTPETTPQEPPKEETPPAVDAGAEESPEAIAPQESMVSSDESQKTPEKLYTEEELDTFWDAVLKNEPYLERVSFGKGSRKMIVVFKTRGSDEVSEIHDSLDQMDIRYRPKFNLKYAQYLLATSLHSYNGKLLPSEASNSETLLEARVKFVQNLSEPVAGALNKALLEFEAKIAELQKAVFSDDF